MRRDERDLSAAIYLFLLRTGGRWKYREVMEAIGCADQEAVVQSMKALVETGRVKKYNPNGKAGPWLKVSFGVTEDCLIPRTVCIRDLRQTLMDEEFALEIST